ncbi:hypothetical protein H9L05_16515 [Hymenobacter qilianensis]|uniref:Uncharacterized protein n=1 Tax=Hymenobacter qilianensis TaxID=1385715 RepID=A0A7H0GTG2_9BACT|nr:hypothetical protein [Hymenobacter qilianensis]QNP51578.1 hypothetical protein H9L05_16515 [Hymenobacter qilianensis]
MKTLTRFPSLLRPLLPLLCCLLLATACHEDGTLVPFPVGGRQAVLTWNTAGTVAVARMADPTTGFFILPHPEARIYAIVNLSMHDALNNIQRRYAPYALQGPLMPLASPEAAVSTAAHHALVAVLPEQKAYADSLYQVSLASIRDGQAKTLGIALGHAAAQAVLATRVGDRSDVAQIPYTPGSNPGDYQFTPPFDAPPFNGFFALAGWRDVRPFALTSAAQFRRVPPRP